MGPCVGERLFIDIHKKEPLNAGKLTSFILTLEIEKIFPLLSDEQKLNEMIEDAKKNMIERAQRDGTQQQHTSESVKQRVTEMRNTHEKTVARLLSPNSGGDNNGN